MSAALDLRTVTAESFAPFVGTELVTETVTLTLTEASPLRQKPHVPEARQPFRLTFTGPAPLLPQGIYTLAHPELEPLDIFLVPIAGNEDGFTYEAIFN
ncbi:hypothetical protein [Armatimonas sp.]|uniref:DUF6916 family protein n=1 Tax=Armatimonas sp. TaxID=1872638 RepID=UPI00286D0B8E|nr:hypothetical protein [Armatimonas sp.]